MTTPVMPFIAGAGGDGGVGCGVHQASHADKEAGERVDTDLPGVHIDTGEPGGLLVGADGVGVTAELGLVENERRDDKEADEPQGAHGEAVNAEDVGADENLLEPAAHGIGGDGPSLGLGLGEDGANALGHHHGAEGGNEGGQLQTGNQIAVEEAKDGADAHGDEDSGDQGPLELLEGVGAQQGGAHHYCTERQVNAAGDDDKGDAEGHKADVITGLQDILDHGQAEERVLGDQ